MEQYLKAMQGGGIRGVHRERLRLLKSRPIWDAIAVSLLVLCLWTPFIFVNLWLTSNGQVQVFNDRLLLQGMTTSRLLLENSVTLRRILQWREDGVDPDWRSGSTAGLLSDWRSFREGGLGAFSVEAGEVRLQSIGVESAVSQKIQQAIAGLLPEVQQRVRVRRSVTEAGDEVKVFGTVVNPVVLSDPFQVDGRWLVVMYGETQRRPEDGGAAFLLLLDIGVYLTQMRLPGLGSGVDEMRITLFDQDGARLLGPPVSASDYACSHTLAVPGGEWRMYGIPAGGWVGWSSGLILTNMGAGVLMATAAGMVTFFYSRVRLRFSAELEHSNLRLSEALEQRLSLERARDQALADLARSRQLESVGRLAGGVAHEFNNLLQVILGHTDLLLAEFRLDKPVSDGLRQVDRAGRRAAELTKQLLEFSRREPQESAVVEIVSAVSEGLRLMRPALKKSTRLIWNAAEDRLFVPLDALHLDQIVLNLLLNADLAMSEGGKIELGVREVAAGESAGGAGLCEQRSVVLTIADEGCGMSEEVLSRVFDPFFSTRGPSAGTGLGLSLVYSLMKQCGGRVHLSSAEGRGTTVFLVFPWCDAADAAVIS